MAWQAEAIKVIIFTPELVRGAQLLWSEYLPGEPDVFQKNAAGPGTSLAAGRVDAFQCVITTQPARIEFQFTLFDPNPGEPTPAPVIADVPAASDLARRILREVVTKIPTVRMAVHLQLFEEVKSFAEANAKLNDLIGAKFFEAGSTDVVVQKNERRPSNKAKGHQLNLLRKWGGLVHQMVMVVPGQPNNSQTIPLRHMYFKHLDFNMVQSPVPIDKSISEELSDELWELALAELNG